jgi:hypothetical protein
LTETEHQKRKNRPVTTGVLDYFPDAILEVARISKLGNDQHNPGQSLHWARGKSTDHADCIVRHLLDRGTIDSDGVTHSAKVAWRALALLQEELEEVKAKELGVSKQEVASRGSRYETSS